MKMQDSKSILIVDDDPSIRKFLEANLTARGYSVSLADGGQQAFQILAKSPVNLILLDIMMPEMDGFAVCQAIRKTSKTAIIMLSAREGEGDSERCLACGAEDYITKPFPLKELLGKIKSYL
jgi:DNA-binding response OmpR family regulator